MLQLTPYNDICLLYTLEDAVILEQDSSADAQTWYHIYQPHSS